jgi:cytochrome b subunit of formate dehydrogenase
MTTLQDRSCSRKTLAVGAVVALLTALASGAARAETDACMACHGQEGMQSPAGVDLFVDPEKHAASIHARMGLECTSCHADLAKTEFPHAEKVAGVDCATCHEAVAKVYANSLHGREVSAGAPFAPRCPSCHGTHDIVEVSSPLSRVTRYRIPFVCGSCHKEGTPVTQTYDIPQEKILEHYSESMHGEGLLKRGLTVVAVCIDCHTSHNVLPHTDPRSSIHRDNIAAICQRCHTQIQSVHRKVIRGELWEKAPNTVPVCVDCHAPHKVRKIYYDEGIADEQCLKCHSDPALEVKRDGKTVSLYVSREEVHSSIHRNTSCAKCHTGTNPFIERPCASVTPKVDCSICHAEVVKEFATSIHGSLAERGDSNAPVCRDCHGVHDTRSRKDTKAKTFPTNVPDLCGTCHREGQKAAIRYNGNQHNVVERYVESIHGKGLLQSGLLVTATCADCHTAHRELPASDERSTVNPKNIPQTCAKCHNGIYEKFQASIHSPLVYKGDEPLPQCADCHTSHEITRADTEGFKLAILKQCGRCHKEVTETYFETFHGKVSKLGFAATAKCHDCHGAHDILPPTDPASHLAREHIVTTCGKCHPGSHRQFAGYLTHATHHDRSKYPVLFYTFWFMTLLLVGTLTAAGLHTVLWLPRSWQLMKERKALVERSTNAKEFRRFNKSTRRLHILVIISFIGLALTGMTLKFSYLGWAATLSRWLGGFEAAGIIHRICALITFTYAGIHVVEVMLQKVRSGKSWRRFFLEGDTLLPNMNDLHDFVATFRWFIGMGPRPGYGRWTYWEKFDYFAVFWGVAVIGLTGLVLWFPELFTLFLPGWAINVATIIHSDEALLAVGFIFTVHFFNTHFRPDRFPMDIVIFTGRVPLEEFKVERPREYEQLVASGELEQHLVEPLPHYVVRGFRIFGAVALILGLILIFLIIWAEVFGYR